MRGNIRIGRHDDAGTSKRQQGARTSSAEKIDRTEVVAGSTRELA